MLPIILDEKKIEELVQYSKRKENIEINLTEQQIMFGNKRINYEIDPYKKECLLNGLDDIALSLEQQEKKSLDFETEEDLVGGASYEKHKKPITDEVFYKALESEAVILGAVGGPKWDNLEFSKRPERAL